LVSVERSEQEDAKQIFDSINETLADLGLEQMPDRDQVKAIAVVVIRSKYLSSILYGCTSKAKVLTAVLSFLVNEQIISEEYARTIYATWLAMEDARQK
jgi:hypothetical protein